VLQAVTAVLVSLQEHVCTVIFWPNHMYNVSLTMSKHVVEYHSLSRLPVIRPNSMGMKHSLLCKNNAACH
jgi:hypothetical protein